MSKETEGILAKLNASGFPLQLGLVDRIAKDVAANANGWTVAASEVPWASGPPLDPQTGFVDLVLEHEAARLRLVIECKRYAEEQVFLAPTTAPEKSDELVGVWAQAQLPHRRVLDLQGPATVWARMLLGPKVPVVEYCLARKERDSPRLLEKELRGLLAATAALARDEALSLADASIDEPQPSLWHIPVLVTSAPLCIVRLDPARIPLDGSAIMRDDWSSTSVDWLLFAKPLAWSPLHGTKAPPPNDLNARTNLRRRSVLIVRASHLARLLVEQAFTGGRRGRPQSG